MPQNVGAGKCDAPASLAAPAAKFRHGAFYLTDEMTVFQVENCLFRVHRHFLAKNSPIFRSMFSLPRIPSEAGAVADEGASDENPIYLSGVTALEFETLLQYFYNTHDGPSLHQLEWIALLSIAHRYEFLDVRARAIREIYDPPGQRDKETSGSGSGPGSGLPDYLTLILTAEKYDVSLEQALSSFVGLVKREESLTEVEITRLSALTVHRLARARELYLRMKERERYPPSVERIVRDIWRTEEERTNNNRTLTPSARQPNSTNWRILTEFRSRPFSGGNSE